MTSGPARRSRTPRPTLLARTPLLRWRQLRSVSRGMSRQRLRLGPRIEALRASERAPQTPGAAAAVTGARPPSPRRLRRRPARARPASLSRGAPSGLNAPSPKLRITIGQWATPSRLNEQRQIDREQHDVDGTLDHVGSAAPEGHD